MMEICNLSFSEIMVFAKQELLECVHSGSSVNTDVLVTQLPFEHQLHMLQMVLKLRLNKTS